MKNSWSCYVVIVSLAVSTPAFSQQNGNASEKWEIAPFVRSSTQPIITPNPKSVFTNPVNGQPTNWEALHTFNPAAIVRNDKIYVLYRAEDDTGSMHIGGHTSRLGLSESSDGLSWTRHALPVFYASSDSEKERETPGGVEDPRIVEAPDGTYVLSYTQYHSGGYDVGIATSPDLEHWTKHGPAFGTDEKFAQFRYKSAGILTRIKNGRLVAAMIDGVFWMYWGEGAVHLAKSTDLIHWTPVRDDHGDFLEVLKPRKRMFDSDFPEVGPPPVLTAEGIVVLYNGKNGRRKTDATGKIVRDPEGEDPAIGYGAYSVGEALFDAKDPSRLLAQADHPVLKPEMPYEMTGQYLAGTTFGEGLVLFHNRWVLFYGTADTFVASAVAPYKP